MRPFRASTPPAHLPQRPPTAATNEVVCSSVSIESTASDAYGIAKTERRRWHALRRGLAKQGRLVGCGAAYPQKSTFTFASSDGGGSFALSRSSLM